MTETSERNALQDHIDALETRIQSVKTKVESGRTGRPAVPLLDYPLPRWRRDLDDRLSAALGVDAGSVELGFIDRQKFGYDLALKIPPLLKAKGNKDYIAQVVPRIMESLQSSPPAGITKVQPVGIYVNIALSDKALFGTLASVQGMGPRFGETDAASGQRVLVDYSSPNAAKALHAGHIRSTIIGHVLANLHDANGATVYRINHINDLGGFGFLIEGYDRWWNLLSPSESNNQKLISLYLLRRRFEKISEDNRALDLLAADDREAIETFFGPCASTCEFQEKFRQYVDASDERFRKLEEGVGREVSLWEQMVAWSLQDFETFYSLLGINIDFVIGESFYGPSGLRVVERALAHGKAIRLSAEQERAEEEQLTQENRSGAISDEEYSRLLAEVKADVGAVVVPLENHQRYVILRSDGRSIYSTRDLGALEYRTKTFDPTRMLYVVGQEQREHFDKLFKSARVLELVKPGVELEHIYFGFYINALTNAKLSSREGAANVNRLLREAIEYFKHKYENEFPEEEKQTVAKELAVGCVIFNDIRKDKKGPVPIHPELEKTISEFEKSGSAYVVYSACRARGIMRKWAKPVPSSDSIELEALESSEVEIIKRVQEFPERVRNSAAENSPSILVNYLLDLARIYNSYYNALPVIKDGQPNHHRLVITSSVQTVLENGLRLCGINCPNRI